MKLIYRQMLSFFAVICTLLIIVTISFINVTNRTLYTNTWRELQQDADSLIQDSIKYDQTTRQFKGLKTSSLKSNANLLARQNVHFAIYDADQQKIFASNGHARPSANRRRASASEHSEKQAIRPKDGFHSQKGICQSQDEENVDRHCHESS